MISIGCDHGGYDLKEKVVKHLEAAGVAVKDCGCYSKDSCDYPVFGRAAAEAVASGECEKGIVICTTGIGISITANKVAGVRCALCADTLSAKMTRLHNKTIPTRELCARTHRFDARRSYISFDVRFRALDGK